MSSLVKTLSFFFVLYLTNGVAGHLPKNINACTLARKFRCNTWMVQNLRMCTFSLQLNLCTKHEIEKKQTNVSIHNKYMFWQWNYLKNSSFFHFDSLFFTAQIGKFESHKFIHPKQQSCNIIWALESYLVLRKPSSVDEQNYNLHTKLY